MHGTAEGWLEAPAWRTLGIRCPWSYPAALGGGDRQGHSKRVAGAHMGGGKEGGEGSLAGVQGEA